MSRHSTPALILFFIISALLGCGDQTSSSTQNYKEGTDYVVYERVRIVDKMGFSEPQEAYSLLLPKGWQHQSDITWNAAGTSCAGTFKWLKAASPDGNYRLQMYPDVLYQWNTDSDQSQSHQDNNTSSNCSNRQPIEAEAYLRQVFAAELGNPEIIKVEPNPHVVQQMQETNAATMSELKQYGAGDIQFNQSAINAVVRWPGGSEGLVVLGVTITEIVVPNNYTGAYTKVFTTQISKRIAFMYPSSESEQVKNQFSAIMGSFRTNPAWEAAVNNYWKDVRQQKHVAHIGTIKMLDEQTRQIGNETIRRGNERLRNMDTDMRNWEARQNTQDRIHTNFIKTIREVENYRDETGKYEISSSYTNAWSRGDGSSFVMSNNPNFDPAFVFKDQAWKEMKKVD